MSSTALVKHRRRMAFIEFPREVYSRSAIEQIAAEGYDDIAICLIPDEGNMGNYINQGFTMAQSKQLHDWAVEFGLAVTVFTGYMKYEEPLLAKEPQRAMITCGGAGENRDSDNLRSNWLCPFRPENIERYMTLMLRPLLSWPALRELHLNDEAFLGFGNGAIGCYCDYCRAVYKERFGEEPPVKRDWQNPSWTRWIEYRFNHWTDLHARLRRELKAVRPDIVVGIQHSPVAPLFLWNPWKPAIDLGRDAIAMDVLATDPYHYMHLNVATLRPHRRLLTEGTRGLAGACLANREMTIYPQGFMPPAQSLPMGRQDGLLAGVVPFAMGADTVAPYTYEMMKIIPGYHEAWDEARKLQPYFDRLRPDAFVTVIAPTQTEVYAHSESDWGSGFMVNLMDVMYRTGLSWQWFWDTRLDDAADQLRGPLIVAEAQCLKKSQLAAINRVATRGEGVLWIGNKPDGAWSGEAIAPGPVESGEYELKPMEPDHELFKGLPGEVILQYCSARPADVAGHVAGTVDGKSALVLNEKSTGRSAWLAGVPKFNCVSRHVHGVVGRTTGGMELLRRLLTWIASRRPSACFDPFPPANDYARIRPWDLRGVHNAELFPMIGPNEIMAVIFPYTPVGFETSVVFHPQQGRIHKVTELWSGEDWSDRLHDHRLAIKFAGGCELMAIHATLK